MTLGERIDLAHQALARQPQAPSGTVETWAEGGCSTSAFWQGLARAERAASPLFQNPSPVRASR